MAYVSPASFLRFRDIAYRVLRRERITLHPRQMRVGARWSTRAYPLEERSQIPISLCLLCRRRTYRFPSTVLVGSFRFALICLCHIPELSSGSCAVLIASLGLGSISTGGRRRYRRSLLQQIQPWSPVHVFLPH